MGTLAPPDGWSMITGDWGTDADRAATPSLNGGYALKLGGTAVATKMFGPWFPVHGGALGLFYFDAYALVQADSIAAGNTVSIKVEAYDATRTSLLQTDQLHAAVLTAANTWEHVGKRIQYSGGATGARWARFVVNKAANAYSVYLDKVSCQGGAPFGQLYDAAGATYVDAGWRSVQYDTASFVQDMTAGTDVLVVRIPGVYAVHASLLLENNSGVPADGKSVFLRLVKNGSTGFAYGPSWPIGATLPSAGGIWAADGAFDFDTGDTIGAEVYPDVGGGASISSPAANVGTQLFAWRIGR